MNVNFLTNLIAATIFALGYFFEQGLIMSIGLFALSGALTNWLAVHMLFEKVPMLYGSGVIPRHFEQFKTAIATLMMTQFFNAENMQKFMNQVANEESKLDLAPVIMATDLSPAFAALVTSVEQSSFGSMLAMFGGSEALAPLKQPFIEQLQSNLITLSRSDEFQQATKAQLAQQGVADDILINIENLIQQRLDELTPMMVKTMVQQIIAQHLGWLVVWGGVFGGVIGALAGLI